MKNCPRCDFVNDDSAKFCKQCGEKLEILQKEDINTCPHCGKELPKGALFCKHCGTPVKQTQKQNNNQKPESASPKRQTFTDVNNTRNTRASTSSTQYQAETSKPKGGNQNVHPLVLGLCLAIVVIVFIAFIALSSTGANDNITSNNSNQNYATENDSYEEEYNDNNLTNGFETSQNSDKNTASEEEAQENINTAENEEYILPNSNVDYLTEADISGLTLQEINYAKNEIYARHGRRFKSQELMNYFTSKSWYKGIYDPDDFDANYSDDALNDYEKKNAEFLRSVEYSMNPNGYELDK